MTGAGPTDPLAADPARVYPPVPGPVDRVSFLDEQTRNRRQSGRFAALAFLGVVVVGLPLCVVITPLLLALALFVAHVAQLFTPLPPSLWRALQSAALALPVVFGIATHQVAQMPASIQDVARQVAPLITGPSGRVTLAAWLLIAGLLALPGSLFLLAAWGWLRSLLKRTGTAALLHKLGARAPDRGDFEENQLTNIVEEMAVACVVSPPPRLLMIDSPAANAAAFGLALDDATIVVTRGLLEQLDRDETQAILAHVVASVGNGDLRIGRTIVSLFQSWGLAVLIMGAPFGRYSRRILGRLFRVALFGQRSPERLREAEAVAELLFRGTEVEDGEDDMDRLLAKDTFFAMLKAIPLLLAFGSAWLGSKIWVQVNAITLFGGTLTKMWRARRLLADASAVQLTRHPDALARALERLAGLDVEVPGAADVSYLFAVWSIPTLKDVKDAASFRMPVKRSSSSIMTMQPTRWRRLERLQAQGAHVDPTPYRPPALFGSTLALVVLAPIALVLLTIFLGGSLVMMAVSLIVTMTAMVFFSMVLDFVFLALAGWLALRAAPSP